MDPDPESGACLTPGSRMGKKSGSNPDHISKSLEIIFLGVKILKFFDADRGIRDGKNSDRDPG